MGRGIGGSKDGTTDAAPTGVKGTANVLGVFGTPHGLNGTANDGVFGTPPGVNGTANVVGAFGTASGIAGVGNSNVDVSINVGVSSAKRASSSAGGKWVSPAPSDGIPNVGVSEPMRA